VPLVQGREGLLVGGWGLGFRVGVGLGWGWGCSGRARRELIRCSLDYPSTSRDPINKQQQQLQLQKPPHATTHQLKEHPGHRPPVPESLIQQPQRVLQTRQRPGVDQSAPAAAGAAFGRWGCCGEQLGTLRSFGWWWVLPVGLVGWLRRVGLQVQAGASYVATCRPSRVQTPPGAPHKETRIVHCTRRERACSRGARTSGRQRSAQMSGSRRMPGNALRRTFWLVVVVVVVVRGSGLQKAGGLAHGGV